MSYWRLVARIEGAWKYGLYWRLHWRQVAQGMRAAP